MRLLQALSPLCSLSFLSLPSLAPSLLQPDHAGVRPGPPGLLCCHDGGRAAQAAKAHYTARWTAGCTGR